MFLSDKDLASIQQSAEETKLPNIDPTEYVQRVIDFLDSVRRKFEHGGWNPGKWVVKQALDTVIAALHQWIEKQHAQPANRVVADGGIAAAPRADAVAGDR